jgi:hypothetical protein
MLQQARVHDELLLQFALLVAYETKYHVNIYSHFRYNRFMSIAVPFCRCTWCHK